MLNKEDTKDVKGAFGKAIAKKVKNATDDSKRGSGVTQAIADSVKAKANKSSGQNKAKKALYDMGAKNKGKAVAAKAMKNAFGSTKTKMEDSKKNRSVKLSLLRGAAAKDKERETGDSKISHFAPSKQHDGYGWKDGHKHKGLT